MVLGLDKKEIVIVIAEDDPGHVTLIRKNLLRSGLTNEFVVLKDGQEALDFFFRPGAESCRVVDTPYLLLLDIRMPKVDGVDVLRQIKQDEELKKLPIIMLTTMDDPREVERCHALGCSNFITKPVEYEKFVDTIKQMGLFLAVVTVPELGTST